MLFFVEASVKVAWVALIQYIVKKINKNFSLWWTNAVLPLRYSVE